MDLGGVLSATTHLISDSAAWRVPSESGANVDVWTWDVATCTLDLRRERRSPSPTSSPHVGRRRGEARWTLHVPPYPPHLAKVPWQGATLPLHPALTMREVLHYDSVTFKHI